MAYLLIVWVNELVNELVNLKAKNHLLLQLEEIKSKIISPQMRRLQCAGVKSLPKSWSY